MKISKSPNPPISQSPNPPISQSPNPPIAPLLLLVFLLLSSCQEPKPRTNFISIDPDDTPEQIITKAASIAPSARQLAWQDLEYTAFIHFGMNTFTNREWGDGKEDPSWFNPTELDARQWASVARDAGMRMILMLAKHHDGFCLWPSAYTEHSVKNSPWRNGKGDLVREVSEACNEFGLKFGVYLSPWDRHEPSYGTEQYNDHFVNQLNELLTQYGIVDEVWFDGACGEGPNGKRQVYDWLRFYTTIRELQPDATIAIMGPDVRWVGTESGYGRVMEWSVVPYQAMNTGLIAEGSQQEPSNGVFIPTGDMQEKDLGSRRKILKAKALVWYPSEVDVSIRPGWFYHPAQDDAVKSPEKLLDIWFSSVGRNSLLLLNLPADTRGLIHENDVASLNGFKSIHDVVFGENLAEGARIKSSSSGLGHGPANVLIPGREKFWMAKRGDPEADLELELTGDQTFDCFTVQENIEYGQRVEQFSLEVWKNDRWREVTRSTTIGNKRMLRFSPQTASRVRLRILQSRATPAISFFALHKRPPELTMEPASGAFADEIKVVFKSDVESNTMYYTLDGSHPDKFSLKYNKPLNLTESSTVRAAAFDNRGVRSFTREAHYTKATFGLSFLHAPSPTYPGADQLTIMDGRKGTSDFGSGAWIGWEGEDMVVTLDYREPKTIKRMAADFLNSTGSWIFLPREVIFEYSSDGTSWRQMGRSVNPFKWDEATESQMEFSSDGSVTARYVRITARSVGTCPKGHAGEGGKAWVFCDEITIE